MLPKFRAAEAAEGRSIALSCHPKGSCICGSSQPCTAVQVDDVGAATSSGVSTSCPRCGITHRDPCNFSLILGIPPPLEGDQIGMLPNRRRMNARRGIWRTHQAVRTVLCSIRGPLHQGAFALCCRSSSASDSLRKRRQPSDAEPVGERERSQSLMVAFPTFTL